ncbi:PREDICTED: thymidine kinase, cytosolic [Nanorana parkeri]|uniref:thymidine kinase, cytosolic n=1 Tax=Nanorana parkeri TaxID=125878 RepID=UPI000854D53B|nr:PREDICTED: thymidine kinase, cytosolic [Nanorana parkeri]
MNCLNVADIMPGSPSKIKGQIQVIFGPMFSGKSTELMRRVRRFQVAQYKCIVIKYANDTRYSKEQLATHDRYVEVIGGADKYHSVCRLCYFKSRQPTEGKENLLQALRDKTTAMKTKPAPAASPRKPLAQVQPSV